MNAKEILELKNERLTLKERFHAYLVQYDMDQGATFYMKEDAQRYARNKARECLIVVDVILLLTIVAYFYGFLNGLVF
jgi:hypothetical protein